MERQIRLRKINHIKKWVDSIIIFENDPNLLYLTNSNAGIFVYDFSNPMMLSSDFDFLSAKKSWFKVKKLGTKDFLNEVLKLTKGVVGVNKRYINASFYEKLKSRVRVKDISKILEDARSIKTNYEIGCIKRSCRINKKIFSQIDLRRGVKECELLGQIEMLARENNSKAEAIVAFGKNTASPHHAASNKKLCNKEPVLVDICCTYRGYYSDVTRTFNHPLEGKMKEFVESVEKRIHPGIEAGSLEKFARKALGKDEKFFTHSLGHGVGLAVHEKPSLSKNSKDILKPCMTFTIEPGLYRKNGVRLENTYLLKSNKAVNLTGF